MDISAALDEFGCDLPGVVPDRHVHRRPPVFVSGMETGAALDELPRDLPSVSLCGRVQRCVRTDIALGVAIIGIGLAERRQVQPQLTTSVLGVDWPRGREHECVRLRLERHAETYRAIAHAIEADTWQAMPNLESQSGGNLFRLPDVGELQNLLERRRVTHTRIEALERSAKNLDID